MKTKLIALLTVPFLTIGLHAEDKPAAPATPAPAAEPGKKDDAKARQQEENFKKADTNSDSHLSLEEFKALPRFKKDNSKAEEIFKRKDTNTDSKLSLEEFTAKPAGEGKKGKGGKGGEHPKKEEAKKA